MPVVVYGSRAGDLLSQLREALADKAQFLGLVSGSNARGALAAGINSALDVDGIKGAYVMAIDEVIDPGLASKLEGVEFVVAQTSYMDALAEQADVVLPTTIWAEKSCSTTNTEGRDQSLQAAIAPPAGVKQDEEILQALAEKLG